MKYSGDHCSKSADIKRCYLQSLKSFDFTVLKAFPSFVLILKSSHFRALPFESLAMKRLSDEWTDIFGFLDRDSLDCCQLLTRFLRQHIDANLNGASLRTIYKASLKERDGGFRLSVNPKQSLYDIAVQRRYTQGGPGRMFGAEKLYGRSLSPLDGVIESGKAGGSTGPHDVHL